jgi:transposase
LVWALAKTAVSELMRIAWRSVGWICQRVTAEESARRDLLAGLSRLGFGEICVRKGLRYLTVIVDHDTGRLVWAHPGRVCKTVEKFLDLLGRERCNQITLVSCDDAEWITRPVSERCGTAVICLDPVAHRHGRDRRARQGPPRGLERRSQARTGAAR